MNNDIFKVIKYEGEKIDNILSTFDEDLRNFKEDNKNFNSQLEELKKLGIDVEIPDNINSVELDHNDLKYEDILLEANTKYPYEIGMYDIFSKEEINSKVEYINKLEKEFNNIHKLDKADYAISIISALLSSIADIVFIKSPDSPGKIAEFVREKIKDLVPPGVNEKDAKVPYDISNRKTLDEEVIGIDPKNHREVSLGHDPILGFIFGVKDIIFGTITTISLDGKIVVQPSPTGDVTRVTNLIEAIVKQFKHLLSDLTTSAGLPVPFMSLFNLLQFGNINGKTIAQIVQEMYKNGYDFVHFISMSIPVAIGEFFTRLCYAIKRYKETKNIKESVPFGKRENTPKLGTMLYISNLIQSAINALKVFITKNPLAINYPQWILLIIRTIKQIKWNLKVKPDLREKYINNKLGSSLQETIDLILAV